MSRIQSRRDIKKNSTEKIATQTLDIAESGGKISHHRAEHTIPISRRPGNCGRGLAHYRSRGRSKSKNRRNVEPKRLLRQSWVLMTIEPSANMVGAIREATIGTGDMVEDRRGKLAVKLAIDGSTDDADSGQT
jgi:hypothetical protein